MMTAQEAISVPIRGLFNLTINKIQYKRMLFYCVHFRPHQGII